MRWIMGSTFKKCVFSYKKQGLYAKDLKRNSHFSESR